MSDSFDISAQLESTFTVEIDGPRVKISIEVDNMPIPVTHLLQKVTDEVGRAMYEAMFKALNGNVRSHDKVAEYRVADNNRVVN